MCSATGTPEQEVEAHMPTESEQVALEILEQLQMSGERDRLKAWLQRELHSKGWTAAMHARAATYAERRESSPESSAAPLKASELAEELGTLGHASIPEPVRARLMKELLRYAREYAQKESVPVQGSPNTAPPTANDAG